MVPTVTDYELRHLLLVLNDLDIDDQGLSDFHELQQALRLLDIQRSVTAGGVKNPWVLEPLEHPLLSPEDADKYLLDPLTKRVSDPLMTPSGPPVDPLLTHNVHRCLVRDLD
eukprot:300439-Prorocentrum_minimum.AAC.1